MMADSETSSNLVSLRFLGSSGKQNSSAGHGLVVSFIEGKSDTWAGGSRICPDWITVV